MIKSKQANATIVLFCFLMGVTYGESEADRIEFDLITKQLAESSTLVEKLQTFREAGITSPKHPYFQDYSYWNAMTYSWAGDLSRTMKSVQRKTFDSAVTENANEPVRLAEVWYEEAYSAAHFDFQKQELLLNGLKAVQHENTYIKSILYSDLAIIEGEIGTSSTMQMYFACSVEAARKYLDSNGRDSQLLVSAKHLARAYEYILTKHSELSGDAQVELEKSAVLKRYVLSESENLLGDVEFLHDLVVVDRIQWFPQSSSAVGNYDAPDQLDLEDQVDQ